MATPYLGDDENLADLVSRIPGSDREQYQSFGHLRVEAVFENRLFIVYKPTGLTREGLHRQPDVLTTVRVSDLWCESKEGACVGLEDLRTGATLRVGYIPTKLFGYNVFVSVPPIMRVRWDGRRAGGEVRRSLAFGLLIKAKNRADFYSAGNTYCETPNSFRALLPNADNCLLHI